MKHGSTLCAAALLACGIAGPAPAWEWRGEPLSFRIRLALDRASVFTDVVARSATAAYPYGSSPNPAADDFQREPPNDFTVVGSATGSFIAFGGGPSLSGGSVSGSWRPPFGGTLTAFYSRTDSRDVSSAQGDHFALHSNEITIRYSRSLLPERLSVGAGVRFIDSTLGVNDLFFDFPRRIITDTVGVEGQLGVVGRVHPQWLLGLFVTGSWSRPESQVTAFLPPPPFGPDTVRATVKDEVRSINVRGGAGWQPKDWFSLFADAQYLQLSGDQGSAEVGRLYTGIEISPIRSIVLRAGGTVDTQGKMSMSTGVGIYLLKAIQAEIAYSYNAFPEVRREFGPAHLISLSIIGVY